MTGARAARAATGIARLWASLTGAVLDPLDRRLPGPAQARERGGATVEFVLLLPAFLMVFISSVESSVFLVRQVMLERAVDIAVRQVRLDVDSAVTQNQIRHNVCQRARILPDCDANMVIELTEIPMSTYATPDGAAPCVDRRGPTTPDAGYVEKRVGKMVMLRACYAVEPILAQSSFAMTRTLAANLVSDEDGALRIVTATAFTVE